MHIGIQLVAGTGTASLCAQQTYYLFANRSAQERTTLLWYAKAKDTWHVYILHIEKSEFEQALLSGELQPSARQMTLPPWLSAFEGVDMDALEDDRASSVKTYRARAEARYKAIEDYLSDDFRLAFEAASDPRRLFSSCNDAKDKPKQNPDRLFLWYCTYHAHGRRLESLMPAYSDIGKWDRSKRAAAGKKLGRPMRREGAAAGHSAIELSSAIGNSYVRWSVSGKTMTDIHQGALLHDFGCRVEKRSDGSRRFYHPEGKPFPDYQQYRYWVVKQFGLENVHRLRVSDERFRSRTAARVGSYSSECANYCERSEADCYYVKDRPTQLLSREPGPPLVACTIVCTTTGMKTGIGFSYGAETAEAYRLAKFCAAAPKSVIGKLFLIPTARDEWPGEGLAPREIFDRGPGTAKSVSGSDDVAPAIRELAQSYSGQAKATVEASHPRSTKLEGIPTFVQSDLNVFQLAKREVMRTIAQNNSADGTTRLTQEMVAAGVSGTPASIAKYLIARGRSDATPVPYETAVREFLTPVKFQLKDDGLWLDGMPFPHNHLLEHGLPARVPRGQHIDVDGYMHPFSVSMGWVEVRGKLFEVYPVLRIRDSEEQLCMTLQDLGQLSQRLRELRTRNRDNALATRAEAALRFLEETGMRWNAGTRRVGKAPSRSGRREALPTKPAKATGKRQSR